MKQRSDVSIYGDIKLYGGSGNPGLAQNLADCLDLKLSGRKITEFPNENLLVQLEDSARGQDVYVIQSTARPVHQNIMELLIMLQTLKLDSAGRITAVVPYMTYARSDKKDQPTFIPHRIASPWTIRLRPLDRFYYDCNMGS